VIEDVRELYGELHRITLCFGSSARRRTNSRDATTTTATTTTSSTTWATWSTYAAATDPRYSTWPAATATLSITTLLPVAGSTSIRMKTPETPRFSDPQIHSKVAGTFTKVSRNQSFTREWIAIEIAEWRTNDVGWWI
jgi:hypothetical protein